MTGGEGFVLGFLVGALMMALWDVRRSGEGRG